MVVVSAAGGAASLRQPDGTANEVGTEGEVPDVEPGAGGKLTVTLPAGKYVLLCNLPGHFAGGMYTELRREVGGTSHGGGARMTRPGPQ